MMVALKPSRITMSASSVSSSSSSAIVPCHSFRRPYVNRHIKGIFAGSGAAAMSSPLIAAAVISLTRRQPEDLSLLYIGTASYDIAESRRKQTCAFADMGVQVRSLDVANKSLSLEAMTDAVDECDIILVSGGNTLYAVDRWEYLGLDNLLKDAALNGKVITGGSAGAICWFDGGHSDSMSPESYRLFKLNKQSKTSGTGSYSAQQQLRKKSTSSFDEGPGSDDETEATEAETDEDSSSDEECSKTNIDWEYIRVKGLGILPGLICPHYDRVQSNGLLRSSDFMMMMKRHLCEVGIGIDHFAALEINGSEFRVLSLPGQIGSVDDDEYGNAKMPGVWINFVDNDGIVHSKLCPRSGQVSDLLQSLPARHIVEDKRVKLCRKLNPPLREAD